VAELGAAGGTDHRFDEALKRVLDDLAAGVAEADARRLVSRMAVLLQASLLLRHAPAIVSDAFVTSRIAEPSPVFGDLPDEVDAAAVVERALPA
jgi:putative acyl-CoA dehydrogenase